MRSFAKRPSEIASLTLSDHDSEVAPDVVTMLFINHEWREFISDVVQGWADFVLFDMQRIGASEASVDSFRNKFQALLNDLYSVENMDTVPVGSIIAFPSTTPPSEKWLYLNGQTVLQADYPELYDLIGNFYTVPPSETNFKVPDFRDKNMRGATNDLVLGTAVGADTHTLTEAELPAHTHTIAHTNAIPASNNAGTTAGRFARGAALTATDQTGASSAPNSGPVGSGEAHNNIPRSILMAYMIKALP